MAGRGRDIWGPDVGKKPGVIVWRIEKMAPVRQPEATLGKFSTGDSYIVLNTYQQKSSLAMNVHFWLGSTSSQDERGSAVWRPPAAATRSSTAGAWRGCCGDLDGWGTALTPELSPRRGRCRCPRAARAESFCSPWGDRHAVLGCRVSLLGLCAALWCRVAGDPHSGAGSVPG